MDVEPWTALYPAGVTAAGPAHESLVAAWHDRVGRDPDATALVYFDGRLSARELDEESDALAVALAELGTERGDRVGIYLQNIPQYAVVLLALWKLGATALVLNPMYRRQELRRLVDDAGATGVFCADVDAPETAETLAGSTRPVAGEHVAAGLPDPQRPAGVPDVAAGAAPRRTATSSSWSGATAGRPLPARRRRDGRRAAHLHLGHDRSAQGRDEHPRQPAGRHDARTARGWVWRPATWCSRWLRCSTSPARS